MTGRTVFLLFAGAWGFAESTLFFIVPDVLLSWLALRRPRLALLACIAATAGALAGGWLMYQWGGRDLAAGLEVLQAIPAIDVAMTARVGAELEMHGLPALFLGPLQGTPYKIYALQAGALGLSLPAFLLVSVPARLLRFVAVVLLVLALRRWLLPRASGRQAEAVLAGAWVAFYLAYFTLMG